MSLGILWAGLKDVVWGLVSLSALTQGSVWNANPLQMGTQTTMPCAQAEDSGLLGRLQSPNWVMVCLISTVVFLPVSIVPRVEKCLGLSVGDRIQCLRSLTADFCKSVCFFISCQSHMSRHPLEGYCELSCQLGKGGVHALDHLVWISWVEGLKGWKRVGEDGDISLFFPTLQQVLCSCTNSQYLGSIVGALKATRNWEGSGVTIWVSDVDSAATIFHPLLSRPISVDMSPGGVRESVSDQGKREVSELSRELFLWGDDWDTQKNLYVCLSVGLPGGICQQLYWHIHNVLVWPGQFFVLVVQALAFEAIFGGLCQVCVEGGKAAFLVFLPEWGFWDFFSSQVAPHWLFFPCHALGWFSWLQVWLAEPCSGFCPASSCWSWQPFPM